MNTQPVKPARQKILVVDDDPLFRKLLADLLERVGFEVRAAPDGRAGLSAVGECHFDLIFSDFRMPGMDGLEMAAAVRRIDPIVPIILITGDVYAIQSEAVARAGITKVLPKPIKVNEFLNMFQQRN